LLHELQKAIPLLLPKLTAQARLHFLPNRLSALEFQFSCTSHPQPSFSPVFALSLRDPALPPHDGKRSCQACAVHRQHFAQLALRHFPGTRKHLQDGICVARSPSGRRAFS
jgi:hypothetical protein